MTDLFLWLSDGTDQPSAQAWEKYSISYWHNKLWTGDPSYKFDSQINNSLVFASQGCALSTSASRVALRIVWVTHAVTLRQTRR